MIMGLGFINPQLGKFLSVDPLTGNFPWYTPYQYAGNTPIWAIDLDGLEILKVTHRSFAPWPKFGHFGIGIADFGTTDNFYGDNRGFSLRDGSIRYSLKKSTARIHQSATIEIGKDGTEAPVWASETRGDVEFIGAEKTAFAVVDGDADFKLNKLTMNFEGSDPLVFPAPDIEWELELQFDAKPNTENPGTKLLTVNGNIKGKRFPAYESFIEDQAGTKVFVKTIVSPGKLELDNNLLNPFWDKWDDIDLKFELDKNNNFTGRMWFNGKETTIDAWNEVNYEIPAAEDLKK